MSRIKVHGSRIKEEITDQRSWGAEIRSRRSKINVLRITNQRSRIKRIKSKKTRIKDQPRIKHLRIKDQKKDEVHKRTLLNAITRLGWMMREWCRKWLLFNKLLCAIFSKDLKMLVFLTSFKTKLGSFKTKWGNFCALFSQRIWKR